MDMFKTVRIPLEIEHLVYQFCQETGIPRDSVFVSASQELQITRRMFYEIKIKLASEQLKEYRYPSDWKQAFKERWFPKWLLKKYPVKYDVLIPKALYPHVSLKDTPCIMKADIQMGVEYQNPSTPEEKFPF